MFQLLPFGMGQQARLKDWRFCVVLEEVVAKFVCQPCNSPSSAFAFFRSSVSKTLGEPAVDRGEKVAGLVPLALIAPEPRHAHRRAKLPGFGLLLARNSERAFEMRFGARHAQQRR